MFNVRCLLACVLSTAAFGLDVGGEWILSVQRQGDRVSADRLKLELSGTDVTGTFGRSSVRGTFAGNVLKLEFLDNRKETEITLTGKPEGDRLTGTAVSRDGLDWLWTAERPAAR
ncbi:MAG TPA: hypothetical protein VES20_07745, partial [Bryobacteraceae bacterium]|nr:hypothetical protein [Bryobacteraceae bacterium]